MGPIRAVPAIVIGAGHAGLAISRCLAVRSIEHVVLERGEVANTWRTERWDSLRLLTPNWQSRLPGFSDPGDQPEGFRTVAEVVELLGRYARTISSPVVAGTRVTSVRGCDGGYLVGTDRGEWRARSVVIATGACNVAVVPALAAAVPEHVRTLTPIGYRRPDELPPGGVLVVGAAATGVQLASEIQRSGRQVTLAVGEHVRVPRTYRGRDIMWWLDRAGILDQRIEDMDDPERAVSLPSFQLIGSPSGDAVDLNALQELGVRLVGRVAGVAHGRLLFSGGLRNLCALADLKLGRLLDTVDEWIAERGMADAISPPTRPEPTTINSRPPLELDLGRGEIATVLWATGFRPDYSWLNLPVLDRKGRLRHRGGILPMPGLFAMGLPFMRRRKSTLIDGAADDAHAVSAAVQAHLDRCSRDRLAARAPSRFAA